MEKRNRITQEEIDALADSAVMKVWEPFPGVTCCCFQLPSGFCITEQSACCDPANYDRSIGIDICIEHFKNQLWQLEGYVLKAEIGPNGTGA